MPQKQKILIIGSGGREHAIGWKVVQSKRDIELYFAPGNAGTAQIGTNIPLKATDISGLINYAQSEKIDLTLALPDDPLALGIVDEFRKANLRIWGPTKAASQLEWSKAFAKDFMQRHNLPTAKFRTFTNAEEAKEYVANEKLPIVIKASGLALGKGVIICKTREEANKALENMLVKKVFGEAGSEVVVEEFLVGPEISIHAFSDGKSYKIFPTSQDHKKVGEGDTGLNTGGMGTIGPLPFVDQELMNRIEKEIVAPALEGMRKDGTPFEGVLYPGLILTKNGPKILEFNARFGDPETQTYMRLLDSDLLDIIDASIDGRLNEIKIKWKECFACNVVLASGGYPEKYEKEKEIHLTPSLDKLGTPLSLPRRGEGGEVVIFHAGTSITNGKLVTSGGRVLGVSATGDTLENALEKAYEAVQKISFEGMQYRKDIGKKALEL